MNLKSLLTRYTVEQLKEAIRLRSQHGRIEALQEKREALMKQVAKIDRKLSKLDGGNGTAVKVPKAKGPVKRRRWKLSAETRRKMSEAAKMRYAGKGDKSNAEPVKKKRKGMSAETRAKMAAAARKRWAKVKGTAEGIKGE